MLQHYFTVTGGGSGDDPEELFDDSSAIEINSTELTDSLNKQYGMCQEWTYWRELIFTTCKVWDSVFTWTTAAPTALAGVDYGNYLIGTSNFTVEGWIWLDTGGTANNPTIMSKYHVNPFHFQIGGFKLYVNNNNQIVFLVGDAHPTLNSLPNRQASIRTNSAINTGQWHHVVAIKSTNNPNNWQIYLDGSNMAVTVTGGVLPSNNLESGTASDLYVGIDMGTAEPWHGRLSRMRMLKLAYTLGDVSNTYNSGCGVSEATHQAELDAPLAPDLEELAQSRLGTGSQANGGQLLYQIFWRDTACITTDTVEWLCEQYIVRKAKSLRYGFNGQERDDEISGQGNTYTAQFWEYDARLGRRWNVDPIFKPWRSPYDVLSNIPTIMIDPEGDDDYFNSDGSFSHSTTTKTSNIYVCTKDGPVLLSAVNNFNILNARATVRIVSHYAQQVGISGRTVGIDRYQDEGEEGMLAYTITRTKGIFINADKGYVKEDFNNFKSVLEHEKLHKDRGAVQSYSDHAQVYIDQMKSNTFGLATEEFQIGNASSLAQYLLNAANKEEGDGVWIDDLIDDFNETNTAGLRIGWDSTTDRNNNYKKEIKVYDKSGKNTYVVKYDKTQKKN